MVLSQNGIWVKKMALLGNATVCGFKVALYTAGFEQIGDGGAFWDMIRPATANSEQFCRNLNYLETEWPPLPQGIESSPPPITLATSIYINPGGAQATTEQLTAPGGSTFIAGEISDNTNPLPGIDLTAAYYTEVEFCFQATSLATVGDVYQFRITKAGVALNTYTATPQLTIGSSGTTYNFSAQRLCNLPIPAR